jgi:hypothetical protein
MSPERVVIVDDSGCHRFAEVSNRRARYLDIPRRPAGRLSRQVERYVVTQLRTHRGERIFVLHEIFDPAGLADEGGHE